MAGETFRSKIGNSYAKKDIEEWQPRLKAELAALKRSGQNRQCCDCGAADVTWASPKLGTFICVTCSDIHRAAGAHITCVKNFSTYLWSPDEVAMMRTVGNSRAKELYRRGAALSWQPQDSKDQKVKICTQLYGAEAVQRAVKQNIEASSAASRAEGGGQAMAKPASSAGAGYVAVNAAPAPKEVKDPSPNWLDDWTAVSSESVPKTVKNDLLDDWMQSPSSVKPNSPVVQNGELDFQKPRCSQMTKHQDDLAEVFGSAFPTMPSKPAVENPFRCSTYVQKSEREKDFWDSVNWDELLN